MAKEKKIKKATKKEEVKVTKKSTKRETKVAPPKTNSFAITTAELAEKLGTTPKTLRTFLRTNFEHLRGEGYTVWGWDKWNDPQLKEIMSAFSSREKKATAHAPKKATKPEVTVKTKKASKKEKEVVEEAPKKKKKKRSA